MRNRLAIALTVVALVCISESQARPVDDDYDFLAVFPSAVPFSYNEWIAIPDGGIVKNVYMDKAEKRIKAEYLNDTDYRVQPEITIWIFNADGVVLQELTDAWLVQNLSPGAKHTKTWKLDPEIHKSFALSRWSKQVWDPKPAFVVVAGSRNDRIKMLDRAQTVVDSGPGAVAPVVKNAVAPPPKPKHVYRQAPRGRRSQVRVFIPNAPLTEAEYHRIAREVAKDNDSEHCLVAFFNWERALVGWDGKGGADMPARAHWLCQVRVDREGGRYRASGFFIPDAELTGLSRDQVVR